jgi:co-chaperonin GroES (HSP10)
MINVLGHRVLVKPDSVETRSAGGIYLNPDERKEKAAIITGTIIDIGATAWKDPGLGGFSWAEIGDKVSYAKYGGKFMIDPENGSELVILNDEDIICKLTSGDEGNE